MSARGIVNSSRRHVIAVAVAFLAVPLAGCDASAGSDRPPTKPPTVSFPDDPHKAPSVPDPIDPRAFIDKPCTSLTSEQQRKYDLDAGDIEPPGYPDPPRYSGTLGRRWEPQVLDGYPAVATDAIDRIGVPPYPRSCYYVVGASDFRTFSVLAQDTDGSSECGLAKKVAADVLSNIKSDR